MLIVLLEIGIFVIGAPYFFSTVWGWIKKWFDPVTVSKIFILTPAEVIPVLSEFMEMKDIPKVYGGELDWEFSSDPAWDEGIMKTCEWENGHTAFPPGPKRWEAIDDGSRLQCYAVGYKDGQPRRELVCSVAVAAAVTLTSESTGPVTAHPDVVVEKEAVAAEAPVVADLPTKATEKTADGTTAGETTETTVSPGDNLPGAIPVAGMAVTKKGEEVYNGDHLTTAPVDELEALKLTDDEVQALKEKKEAAAVPAVA